MAVPLGLSCSTWLNLVSEESGTRYTLILYLKTFLLFYFWGGKNHFWTISATLPTVLLSPFPCSPLSSLCCQSHASCGREWGSGRLQKWDEQGVRKIISAISSFTPWGPAQTVSKDGLFSKCNSCNNRVGHAKMVASVGILPKPFHSPLCFLPWSSVG